MSAGEDSVSPTGRYIPGVPDRSGSPKPIAIARPPSKDNLESMLSETKTPIKIIDPTYSGDEKASIKESEEVQSLKMNDAEKRRGRIYLCATCLSFFMAGWIDATLGPLIPRIRETYELEYKIVSLLFVAASLGFIFGSGVLTVLLSDRLGFGKMMVLGSLCQVTGLSIQATAPPFPALAISCCINSCGWGLQMASGYSFVSAMRNAGAKLGMASGCWGLGATISPLVATQFAPLEGRKWAFHFLVSLGIAATNLVSLLVVLRGRRAEELLELSGASTSSSPSSRAKNSNSFRNVIRYRAVFFLNLWSFAYIGLEFTAGGWVVTYLKERRGGGASSGYGSTGFYGGLTLGRFLLIPLNKKVGERRVFFLYIVCAMILQIIVWLVPSLPVSALGFALIGLCLGSMWPLGVFQSSRVLPASVLPGALGVISAAGNAGVAILPWGTGSLMGRWGVQVCAPFILGIMGLVGIAWALIPSKPAAIDEDAGPI